MQHQKLARWKQKITTEPLSQLKKMMVSQLKHAVTHEGFYLHLQVIVIVGGSSNAMLCVDQEGKQVGVQTEYFPYLGRFFETTFSQGDRFFVKQPFFQNKTKILGVISILNGSEVVFNRQTPSKQFFREEGKKLAREKKYLDAYGIYCDALDCIKDQKDRLTLYLNKALMCLQLNLKEEYAQCIRSALKIDPNNQKAHYHLLKYEIISTTNISEDKFRLLKQKTKENKHISQQTKEELMKTIDLHQTFQTNTKISWYQVFMTQNLGQLFSRKLIEKQCKFGRGLFATENIAAGQVLIVEQPMFVLDLEYREKNQKGPFLPNDLSRRRMTQVMVRSEEFKQKLLQFSAGGVVNSKNKKETQLGVSDMIQIYECNFFQIYELGNTFNQAHKDAVIGGFYNKISLINHRCACNCEKIFIGKVCVIYATEDIKADEQLFIAYKNTPDYATRKDELKRFGIECDCTMCQDQQKELKGEVIKNPQSNAHRLLFCSERWKRPLTSMKVLRQLSKESESLNNLNILRMLYSDAIPVCHDDGNKLFARVFPMTLQEIARVRNHYK